MRIYGVPVVGHVFVEAESPEAASEAARAWAQMVLKASLAGESADVLSGVDVVFLNPQEENIKDATAEVLRMVADANL